MRQGHKMRDGSKRAEKNATRKARRWSGRSKERGFRDAQLLARFEKPRLEARLGAAVERRFPKWDRIAFQEATRPQRVERPRVEPHHLDGAKKPSREPRHTIGRVLRAQRGQ